MAKKTNGTHSEKEVTNDGLLPPVLIASENDFATIKLEEILAEVNSSDAYLMEQALGHAMKAAERADNTNEARAYQLLMIICTIHLRVDDPSEPWGATYLGSERRTYAASDFRGDQNAALASIVDRIGHSALRAKIADIVWYNDRSQGTAAATAISAYCDVINRRLNGTLAHELRENESVLDSVDLLERALHIASMALRHREIPENVLLAFEAVYARAYERGQFVAFERVATLGVNFALVDWIKVAPDAKKLADERSGSDYPMAIQAVWNLAARGYMKIGDEDSKRECLEKSVEETLRMRQQVSSAAAQAYWTRKAIGELRAARGFQKRISELRKELRELQDASLDEFGQFTIPLDVTQERQGTIEIFEGLTLPDVLLHLAFLASSPKLEQLKCEALELRSKSLFSSLFSGSYSDHEGKTVAETPPGKIGGEPSDAWLKEQYLQIMRIRMHQLVLGCIEPARHTIMARFPMEIRHFFAITQMSPFVPPGHEHIFSLGFARLIQGDATSAAYLLIPQLENSLRHVMLNASRETSKIKPDLLQEDRSLSGMLGSLRPELEEVFGADIVNEIDLLFHHSPGPRLRHEMAHGKVSAGYCYQPTVIYATWLIYRLTCLPLKNHWKDFVAPAIEQAGL